MKFDGLFPVGTVVLLKDSTKRLMIIGLCQQQADSEVIWDYAGCVFPEGYMGPDKTYLFNNDQIDRLYALGYQDDEQLRFKEKADAALLKIRAEA